MSHISDAAAAEDRGDIGGEAEMTIDTLAYAKALEAAGLDRRDAEAQVAALVSYVLPDLVSRDDLQQAVDKLGHELRMTRDDLKLTIEKAVHQQSWRLFGMVFAVVSLLDGILFALLRVVPPPH
jgi:hypothetical protein